MLFAGSQATGVASRWARTKVTDLMDSLHEGADPEFVRGEVVSLALEHRLVTRYTSLIAVEQIPSALGDSTTVPLASVLPRGGTDGPRLRLLALAFAALGGLAWISGRILRGA